MGDAIENRASDDFKTAASLNTSGKGTACPLLELKQSCLRRPKETCWEKSLNRWVDSSHQVVLLSKRQERPFCLKVSPALRRGTCRVTSLVKPARAARSGTQQVCLKSRNYLCHRFTLQTSVKRTRGCLTTRTCRSVTTSFRILKTRWIKSIPN